MAASASTGLRRRARFGGVLCCRRGTIAVEFAIAAVPFVLLLIGIMELAWQFTTAAALDAAVLRASRFGITGQATTPGEPAGYTCRSQTIAWIITSSTGGFLKSANVTVSTAAYGNASDLSSGTPVAGAGTGGQVVTYNVTYTQPLLTGAAWMNLVGGSAAITHHATVVVKNEPFDDNPAPC
jgi:Flp pilus assembly protein TadG